jgi:hypothetical protein
MDAEVVGRGMTSIGGPLIVANTNSQALNRPSSGGSYDILVRPWALYGGTGENHGNIRPIAIGEFGSYLNLYHIWREQLILGTAPRVQVFGRLPRPAESETRGRQFPYDDDAEFPNIQDFWVLLEDPNESNEYLEFEQNPTHAYASQMWVSRKRTVYLQGCKEVIVAITQAAVFDDTLAVGTSSSSFSDQTYGMIGAQISG